MGIILCSQIIRKLRTANYELLFNNVYIRVLGLSYRSSASTIILYTTHNINNMEAWLRRLIHSFIERLIDNSYVIINTLINSFKTLNWFCRSPLTYNDRILICVPSITLATIFLIYIYIKIFFL